MNDETHAMFHYRLGALPFYAKVTLTLFLVLVGGGYLVATGNVYYKHNEADLVPGMSLDDLRAAFHGMDQEVTEERHKDSEMLKMVAPGGPMRRFLDKGGPAAVETLMSWLEDGAPREKFTEAGAYVEGGPSPQAVIKNQCVECHHAAGGEMKDVPYATDADSLPQYTMVIVEAEPEVTTSSQVMHLSPPGIAELVHTTHAHILTIPVFTLAMALLFMGTGWGPKTKLILMPLPMLATLLDIASWWLARPIEPFIYLTAAAGALFALSFGLQVLLVFGALWFGQNDKQ